MRRFKNLEKKLAANTGETLCQSFNRECSPPKKFKTSFGTIFRITWLKTGDII